MTEPTTLETASRIKNAEALSKPAFVTPVLARLTNGEDAGGNNLVLPPSVRGGVRFPGLPLFPLGTERYAVKGGMAIAVEVFPDDQITLLDEEGLQPCAIAAFKALSASNGKNNDINNSNSNALALTLHSRVEARSDLGLIGADSLPSGARLSELLASADAQSLRERLKDMGCDLAQKTKSVFSAHGRPGCKKTFTARTASLCVVCAAEQNTTKLDNNKTANATSEQAASEYTASIPPSTIMVYIKRAEIHAEMQESEGKSKYQPFHLPTPLAEPLQEFTLQPGEAKAYVVKKGQYVQILDVRGQECSDFQAFDLRALDKNRLRDIDPTTTRSLMGALYPSPGLYAKYFTIEHKPIIEIVQDTVGRHDSFSLACTARYYEDAGYLGHTNCSDNLNAQALEHSIAERKGWPAINFFFNTMLDADYRLDLDEPWTRPGDYVLLRALDDLLCFSTACPCDIDAANGWNPTEVHVRVYDSDCNRQSLFSQGIGFRMTPQSDATLTKETAFHASFARQTRNFTEYNGYWLADDFTNLGALSEYWACREKVIVTDLSPLRKYDILGPDATALVQWCVTRDMRKLAVGQVVYSAMCYEHGGMIDDGTVLRLGDNNFRWIGGCDNSGLWLKEQAERLKLDVWVKNSTEQQHNIAVQGPLSRKLLEKIFWTPPQQPEVAELGWFRFTVARLGDFGGAAVVISRTGYTGELGYEIFCHPRDASTVFDAVWAAGEEYGIKPLGLAALDLLRIEAGLIFAGSEFCDRTDPFEAGIGFTVPLKSKQDDFCGRAALQRRKDSPSRKLVGLEIASNLVPNGGDCLREGRAQIGEITSAMRSPILGKTIALARLDIEYISDGREIEVGQLDGQQKRIPASIVPFPFYDPKKERVRA